MSRQWGGLRLCCHSADLDRMESWVMRFSKAKCGVLHLGRNNGTHLYRLEAALLDRSSAEGDV